MKTNKVGTTESIFQAFDMEKFFDTDGFKHTLHTLYTKGKISEMDYRMWFMLNNRTRISILTPVGEKDNVTIMNGIGSATPAQRLQV